MTDRRLLYRVILKFFTVLAVLVLAVVFINSLFINNPESEKVTTALPVVKLSISAMRKGEIRKARWQGKEVAVLFREKPVWFHTKYIANLPHRSLNSGARSFKPDYFVYFNYGDTGNCPLFYNANFFKDTCSGKLFDTSGREKNISQQGFKLEIPAHYFEGENIIFGRWNPQ